MGLQAQLNLTVINSVAAKSQKKMMEEGFALTFSHAAARFSEQRNTFSFLDGSVRCFRRVLQAPAAL
jgi:hypothetical protein